MGQCGCGDYHFIDARKIGDLVLATDEYWGCEDCDNPIGVSTVLIRGSEAELWGLKTPKNKFLKDGHDSCDIHFPFIGREELCAAAESLKEEIGDWGVSLVGGNDEDGYASLKDFFHDYGLKILQEAMKHRKHKSGNLRL